MTVAQAMLLVGLILVLIARVQLAGCPSGRPHNAKAQDAQNEFNDRWEAKTLDITQRSEELQGQKAPTAEDTKALDKLRDDSGNLNKDMEKERNQAPARGVAGSGPGVARDVATNNQLMGYWRELLFVVGTVFLTIGLIAVGIQGKGASAVDLPPDGGHHHVQPVHRGHRLGAEVVFDAGRPPHKRIFVPKARQDLAGGFSRRKGGLPR